MAREPGGPVGAGSVLPGAQRAAGERLSRRLIARPSQLHAVRQLVTGWASSRGFEAARVEALVLASGEALANVIRHAYADGEHGGDGEDDPAGGVVDLQLWVGADGRAVMRVRDYGTWRDPAPADAPGTGLTGRGITIMRALMDHVAITTSVGGTEVVLVEPWPGTGER